MCNVECNFSKILNKKLTYLFLHSNGSPFKYSFEKVILSYSCFIH